MSRLTKDFRVLTAHFCPDFIKLLPFLLLKSVTFLVFCPFPGSLFSPNFCLSVSWIFLRTPLPPFLSAPGSVIA